MMDLAALQSYLMSLAVLPAHLPAIMAGAFLGGFVLGLTGFGNGLASYGIWLHFLAPTLGAPLVAIGSVVSHMVMYRGFSGSIVASRVVPIVAGGLLGIPIGVYLLTTISVAEFKLFAGSLLCGYAALSLLGGINFTMRTSNRFLDGIAGFLGGICGGLASLSGPILTIWCGLKGWTKDEQRGAYQPYNFVMLLSAVISFAIAGLITRELITLVILTLPVTLFGVWIGRLVYGRVDDAMFRKIVLVLLTLSGAALVWSNLHVVS